MIPWHKPNIVALIWCMMVPFIIMPVPSVCSYLRHESKQMGVFFLPNQSELCDITVMEKMMLEKDKLLDASESSAAYSFMPDMVFNYSPKEKHILFRIFSTSS